MQDLDVLIVGGGIMGLATALGLYKNGFKVAVVEANDFSQISSDLEFRVSAISRSSENFIKSLNSWKYIQNYRFQEYKKMFVWDDTLENSFSISTADVIEKNLGYIIENSVITNALYHQAQSQGLEVFTNSNIIDIKKNNTTWQIITNNNTLNAKLVVGCDGANSFIRNQMDFDIKQNPYNHTALVATIKTHKEHNNTAFQKFNDDGILAFLPLEDKHKCSIVWSLKTELAKDKLAFDMVKFQKSLRYFSDNILGEVEILSPMILSFPLIARESKEYVKGGIALIGDAGHTIHPLAGQGVNLGFKDAQDFIKIISQAFKSGEDISSLSVLERYNRSRKIENKKILFAMRGFKKLFCEYNQTPIISNLRRLGLKTVNKHSLLKKFIVKQALY